MPTQIFLPTFKGLNPLFDRRKVQDPYVVDGINFVMEADGPKSSFGRSLLSYQVLTPGTNVQTFKISETKESLILDNEAVSRFDTETGQAVIVHQFTSTGIPTTVTSEFPWTMAAVGNRYYFARKDAELIEYDIGADSWTSLLGGSIPDNIHACTESDGRLIVLTDLVSAWSAIGNGQDFAASTITGAGAQALNKLGLSNPTPLGVKSVTDGYLTFLSSGIMKSKSVVATNPYRHSILSRTFVPINPYCITLDENDAALFLTRTGFFLSSGEKPQPWQVEMGEYFHTSVIRNLDVATSQSNLQISYDHDNQWFSVWVGESANGYIYNKAYVLNTKVEQWGLLDTPFTALAPFFTLPSSFKGFIFGLIDNEGSIYRFDFSKGVEFVNSPDAGYDYHHFEEEYPARKNNNVTTYSVRGKFKTKSQAGLDTTGVYYRYHEVQSLFSPVDRSVSEKNVDEGPVNLVKVNSTFAVAARQITKARQLPTRRSLNAFITVGPIRLSDGENSDLYSFITDVNIGTLQTSASDDTVVDWGSESEFPGDVVEDWEVLEGIEDWGFSSLEFVDYDFDLISTLDGYNAIANFIPVTAKVNTISKTDYYSCESMAVYHLLKISALEDGQSFDVKTLDISINAGGRL